jgi:hypothetical protein
VRLEYLSIKNNYQKMEDNKSEYVRVGQITLKKFNLRELVLEAQANTRILVVGRRSRRYNLVKNCK